MPEIAHRPFAILLTLGVIAALAVVVVHARLSETRRGSLESVLQTTAVGDRQLYPFSAEPPAVSFRGRPLLPASPHAQEVRETKVVRVGQDDSGQFNIYAAREPDSPRESEPDRSSEPFYFLKTGVNEFLKVQARR